MCIGTQGCLLYFLDQITKGWISRQICSQRQYVYEAADKSFCIAMVRQQLEFPL